MASGSPTTSSDALAQRFLRLREAGHKALIPYITAGYPDRAATPRILEVLVEGGADVIELGVPFSDPVADGPTIQRSSQRALEQGATLAWTLDVLAAFRQRHDVPVVLFSYLNPILRYGVDAFLDAARSAGADGVLITDLPVGSDPALEDRLERAPIALVRLIAPTSPPERAREIARHAQGFLYYIARTGVTGATSQLRAALTAEVAALREETDVPVAVGFGISTPAQATEVGRVADGVVVGSALIDALDRGGLAELQALMGALRDALDDR